MRKLLPILLALIGTAAGVGAGLFLMPKAEKEYHADAPADCLPATGEQKTAHAPPPKEPEPLDREYVKLNNQFVVPVVGSDRVSALVVASLSVEVANGSTESVYQREPKLRDVFLQVLFDHANLGGFQGNFTTGDRMNLLRTALLEAATPILGDAVTDVLITEIARQDV